MQFWIFSRADQDVSYNENIAPAIHVLNLPNYNPPAQIAASHSLPNVPPLYLISSSLHPYLQALCVVFICMLFGCVRMAFGMNDYVSCSVITTGDPRSVASVHMSIARFILCLSLNDDKLRVSFLAFCPPPHTHS